MAQQDPKAQQTPRDPRDVNIKYKQQSVDVANYTTANNDILTTKDTLIVDIEALNYEDAGTNPLNDDPNWIALKALFNDIQPQG